MADTPSASKGTAKKSGSSPQSAIAPNTSTATANSIRLPAVTNARLERVTSQSLEKLSFISEKDCNSDLENYHLEYSTYLLRKAQSRVLARNKEEKEEKVKKCFVSLKCELENLLGEYVRLSKEIIYMKTFIETQKEVRKKIEDGKKLLDTLKENKFEDLLKLLSSSLDHTVNQLRLIDIDKRLIDEMFSGKTWGLGSEIDEWLKRINASISRNKDWVSKIATELTEIRALSLENKMLTKRLSEVFQQISSEIVETQYKSFTDSIKKAFSQREDCKDEMLALKLNCDADFLLSGTKPQNTLPSFELSRFEGSSPKASSSPLQN